VIMWDGVLYQRGRREEEEESYFIKDLTRQANRKVQGQCVCLAAIAA
jgi:hypothetical protein